MVCLVVAMLAAPVLWGQGKVSWRAASAAELEAFLPARAAVEKERIETEMRTATGITDDHGHTIGAVVLITAGYAAEGKYSHYMLAQSPMVLGGEVRLAPGAYVIGWNRGPDGLAVHLFDAMTGMDRGTVMARASKEPLRVEPFRIWPPGDRSAIQIGRFLVPYALER